MQEATCAKGEMTKDAHAAGDDTFRSKVRKCAKCDSDECDGELHQIGKSDVCLCQRCLDEVIGGYR